MEKYFSYEKILELDPHILQKYIQWIFPNNETSTTPHEDHDIEELQAIFYSFIESQQYFEHIYEISCQFNESYELINMILESNLYKLTPFLYDQLLESSTSVVAGIGKGYGEIIPCLFKDNHIIIPINITKIGDILILFDDSTEENITLGDDIYVVCDKIIKGYRIISYGLRFGYHELEFHTNILSNKSRNYLITNSILFTSSPVYTYCLALDSCLDYLTWGWTGNWTNELEIAILELLISVNDDLVTILLNMRSMFSGIFSTGVDDLEEMLKIIQEDLRLVLTTKSNYSLGRLHQTFLQFLEMNNSITGAFMKIPQQFIQAIEAFYLAKISASPLENLFNEILTLYNSAILYQHSLKDSPNRSRHTTELQYVTQFIDTFSSRFSLESYSSPSSNITANTTSMDPIFHKFVTEYQHSTVGLWPNKSTNGKLSMTPMLTYHEIRSIFNLKPSEMTVLSSGFQLQSLPDLFSKQTTQSLTNSISYHPVLPLEVIMNSSRLQQSISWYSESLLMDAIFIQSMLGYSIKEVDNSIEQTCQILKQILDNGLTYVISQPSAKLIILYPLHRSMIFLQNRYDICTSMDIVSHTTSTLLESSMKPEIIYDSNYTTFHKSHQSYIPITLQKRIKDFPRIFRNKIQKKLSFRINTNFDYSLHVLREHHGNNCWINSDLEIIWRYLLIQKQFYIFELWYDDTILLAADYCHLSNNNRSIYVATRYHNNSSNEYKTFQSGYLLSSISCQYLQQKGYLLWDLGGIDMCPLMKYKYDLCGESYHRAESFYLLKKLQQYTPSSTGMSSSSSTIPYQGGEVIDEGVIIENITLEDTLWRERDC